MLRYLHSLPGRLRIRTDALRSPAIAKKATIGIASLPGVRGAATNPHTGSLTIYYDPTRLGPEAVWDPLHRLGLVPETIPSGNRIEADGIAAGLSRQVLVNLGADLISRAVFGLLF